MPQRRDRVTEYRNRAEACRLRAEMTNDREVRTIYLDMAQQWEMMARQIERR